MRIISRIGLGILICSLLLVSCGGVTPAPTMAPILTSTALPTVTDTLYQTPTLLPTSVPTSETVVAGGPELSPDKYHLRTLSSEDYDAIFKYVDETRPGFMDSYQNGDKYLVAFNAERWIQSQEQEREKLVLKILNYDPDGIPVPGMRPGQDLAAFVIEDSLNRQNIKIDQISDYLINNQQDDLFNAGLFFSDSLNGGSTYVSNLFGDGQDAFVFTVQTFSIKLAVLAAHHVNGRWQVDKIRDWEQYGFVGAGNDYGFTSFDDLDGNGIPELGVVVTTGHSGTPQHWSQTMWLYEWDASDKKFYSDNVDVYNQDCDIEGPCKGDWKVDFNKNGQRSLVVSEYLFTLETDYSESPLCNYLSRQSSYLWNGRKFIFQDKTILPPQSKKACEIAWAYTVLSEPSGWKNDSAIQMLSSSLLDWPDEIDKVWGNASKAYFQFKLGIWRDFRGENNQALELLKTLPQNSQFLNSITNAYLEERSNSGFLSACQKVNQLQSKASREKYPVDLMPEWGFGSNLWIYNIPNLCDENNALESLLVNSRFSTDNDLATLLDKYHLSWSQIHDLEVSKLSIHLWFVVIAGSVQGESPFVTDALWMLVKTTNGVEAMRALEDFRNTTAAEASLRINTLDIPQRGPIVVAQFGRVLGAYQVLVNGNIRTLFPASYFYSLNDFQVVQEPSPEIFIWIDEGYTGNQVDVQRMLSYVWDDARDEFVEMSTGFDFESAKKEVDQLLFQSQDFSAVIISINKILFSAPSENIPAAYCSSLDCRKMGDWYHPYFRYLLGLAYELADQPEQAKLVYYELWRDYPESAFGLAASLKLELVKP